MKQDKIFEAFKTCNNAGIIIYPVPVDEFYYEGKKRIPKVKIEVSIDGSKRLGTQLYKQNEELYNKICELYLHYKERIS